MFHRKLVSIIRTGTDPLIGGLTAAKTGGGCVIMMSMLSVH